MLAVLCRSGLVQPPSRHLRHGDGTAVRAISWPDTRGLAPTAIFRLAGSDGRLALNFMIFNNPLNRKRSVDAATE
jgi:hypothetical protein